MAKGKRSAKPLIVKPVAGPKKGAVQGRRSAGEREERQRKLAVSNPLSFSMTE